MTSRVYPLAAAERVLAVVDTRSHYHDVGLGGVRVGQHLPQVIEVARVARRDQDIAGAQLHRFGAELGILRNIELVESRVRVRVLPGGDPLGDGEDSEENNAECDPCDGCQLLREQVNHSGREQYQRDREEADGDFDAPEVKVAWYLPLAIFRLGIAQHRNCERLEREAPDHAEGVQRSQQIYVAAAGNDGEDLQADDKIDDAVAGAELLLRLAEPGGEHAVFTHSVEYAVGAHDGGVDRAGKNENADQHDKTLKHQTQGVRTDHIHGQPANQVGVIVGAHLVGDDHDREKRNQSGEQQAVQKDHQSGPFQVLELGMFDLAIDLGQRFLAAHGQHRMAEAHQHHDEWNARGPGTQQPTERLMIVVHGGGTGKRRQVRTGLGQRNQAPDNQQHHHHRGDLHDLQGAFAGFVNALGILPPEIKGNHDGEKRRKSVARNVNVATEMMEGIGQKPCQILACRHRADRSGEHVIEEQSRNR